MDKGTILVGTAGQGVFRSTNAGETWGRAGPGQGMHSDAVVRCLRLHPDRSEVLYAGTDLGLYKTDDAGGSWHRLPAPFDGQAVWALAIDSRDPKFMIAGTGTPTRPCLYRSEDGGANWRASKADIAEECPAVGVPRPTAIAMDPENPRSVWAGIEVDGIRHSADGGETWQRVAPEIQNPDVHNLTVTRGPHKSVVVLTNDDVWLSRDDGATWRAVGARQVFPWHYPRGVAVRPDDPNVIFVTLGDTTPGRTGAIMRSRDAGETWESLVLPGQPNSAMWTLGISRESPDQMLAASRYGYLYRSEDGGDSWERLWREFSEVSSLALLLL